MSRAPAVLLILIALLATGAGAVLMHGAVAHEAPAPVREFHQMVGGLGLGPQTEFEPSAFGFDSRLCPACLNDVFCPYHAGTLFDDFAVAP